MSQRFRDRYGPWALVAGASEGLGAEFARQLASHGLDLVLLARRRDRLEQISSRLHAEFGREVRCEALDLARPDLAAALRACTQGLEIGLAVYNAALAPIGPFFSMELEEKLRTIDVNCRGPLVLAHELGGKMVERGRGGIILMSSMAGFQGAPWVATYGASKAFDTVLGESLWEELGASGVHVLACCAGPTRTPNYEQSKPRGGPAPMEPSAVVSEALAKLGSRPSLVPGATNRSMAFVMGRLLSRRMAVRIFGKATRRMYTWTRPG